MEDKVGVEIDKNENKKKKKQSVWVKIIIGMVIILVGYYIYNTFFNPSSQAKRDVEKYMQLVKNGGDSHEYIGIGVEGFIDVFDFKYLDTLEIEQEKDIYTYNYDDYEIMKKNSDDPMYDTYDSYKEYWKDSHDNDEDYEIINDDYGIYEVWKKGDYKDKHKFLYNVTIANGAGQQIFKKAEITMEKRSIDDNYKVIDIYMR